MATALLLAPSVTTIAVLAWRTRDSRMLLFAAVMLCGTAGVYGLTYASAMLGVLFGGGATLLLMDPDMLAAVSAWSGIAVVVWSIALRGWHTLGRVGPADSSVETSPGVWSHPTARPPQSRRAIPTPSSTSEAAPRLTTP
jgi:hypothetical protein